MRTTCVASACLLAIALPLTSHGQSFPEGDVELRRGSELLNRLRDRQELSPEVRLDSPHQALGNARLPNEHPCWVISRVEILGLSQLPIAVTEALSGSARDDAPEGRCLAEQGVELLVQRLQNALIAQGLITTRARVEPQDLSTGVLQLSVIPGRVGRLIFPLTNDQADIPSTSLAVKAGQLLNLRDLEQTLENLKRNASTSAEIEISPGEQDGTSDVSFSITRARPWRMAVSLDNSGSRTTGKWQGGAVLTWDSPLGLGDQVHLSVGRDVGGRQQGSRGSGYHMFHYSLPVGYWLFGFVTSSNRFHQTIFDAGEPYPYRGVQSSHELQATRVVARDARGKTSVSAKLLHSRSSNFVEDTEVLVQRRRTPSWQAGVSHVYYGDTATWNMQANFHWGADAAPPRVDGVPELGRTKHTWRSTQMHVGVSRPISAGPWRGRYAGQWLVQWAPATTPLHKQLCLGGEGSVRGFDDAPRLCGTSGATWRNELAFAVVPDRYEAFVAVDVGRVRRNVRTEFSDRSLAGVAIGLRHTSVATALVQSHAEIMVSRPLRYPAGFERAKPVVSARMTVSF